MSAPQVTTDMVRKAMQSFGEGGREVAQAQLSDALGLDSETEKARMRSRIQDMVGHGEVTRVRDGIFVYNFNYRPRESKALEKIWRFVRKAKPGWSVDECALLTRVSYSRVLRYCSWLEEAGFVIKIGKNTRRANAYKGTAKADATPETPYPPQRETDPFEKERVAAATITRLMLCADPYTAKTGRDITAACNVLLERFGKNFTKNENTEEVRKC